MNIIVNNSTGMVWTQTPSTIQQQSGVYYINGVSAGISVAENTIVTDATDCPYFEFIPQAYSYAGGVWSIYSQETYQSQVDLYNEAQSKKRFAAYTVESDPIFFKSQRGEATNQQWLDAVAAIDARFPYQE
jgi:hypothetical protein